MYSWNDVCYYIVYIENALCTSYRNYYSVSALIPIVGAFIGCIVGVILIMMTSPLKALIFVGDSLYYSRLKEILYILMLLEALSDYREYGCLLLLQSVAICLV